MKSGSGPFARTINKKTINLQWCIGTNSKTKIIKMLESNIGEYLWDLGVGEEFWIKKKKRKSIALN